jgi:ubiquinone/menaquinone biosynthesis C-methylase UbiE
MPHRLVNEMADTKPVERNFTVEQARTFYDFLGSRLDWQRFFEDPAFDVMVRYGDFDKATSVLEFGCGTGRMAERLLSKLLPENACYRGCDISGTMLELARKRLKPWAERATVRLSDGYCTLVEPNGSVDRVVCTFVLDLLGREQINLFISEAFRVLVADGLLCVASLNNGQGALARAVSSTWRLAYALSPWIVGGCRPIDLTEFLSPSLWDIRHVELVRTYGFTSQVVVASKRAAN